jgi:YVTN family beta-propeller protein
MCFLRRPHLSLSAVLPIAIVTISLLPRAGGAADPFSILPPITDSRMDSPDGDPPLHTFTFPAELAPLGPIMEAFTAAGARNLTADLAPNGIPPEGDTPTGVTFTPDGTKILVAHRDTRNLILFDAATRAFLDDIPLSGSPNGVAVSPDGTRAVTPNILEDTASIVDLATGAEIAVIPVGDQPGVVRISPDGTLAVIGNTVSGSLSVIDLATATEVRRIPGVAFVGSVSISFEAGAVIASFASFEFAGNTRLVHPDYYGNRILVVDVVTGAVTSLPASNTPRGVAVTPDGTKAVVTHFLSVQVVSVVDPAIPAIVSTIPIGADLFGPVSVDPTGTKAVVAVQNACRVVNLVTHAVSPSLATASVNQLLTTAGGSYALAVGFRGSLVSYATETVVKELNNVVSTTIGAVSPVGPRAAMVADLFGEDMLVVNTNGAAGFIEGVLPSGPAPEGDKARMVALRPDGSEAVAVNIFSDNVSIVDTGTLATAAIIPVGNRPAEVEITPDGTKAVVANLDSDFVSILNLDSRTVTNVTISTRGSEIEISPDGQYAYVAVVVTDGVWRIDLATLTVAGPELLTGNMGSINYPYFQSSGMTLSHDGGTLVTCNSFSNTVSIIDTGTWSVVSTLTVGTFPVRATFSADDSLIYVSSRDDDRITEIANAGSSSVVLRTIPVGDWPYEMVLAPGGSTLYVANYLSENIGVVNLASGSMTSTIALPDPPAGIAIDPTGDFLYAATGTWSVSLGPGPVYSVARSGQFSVVDLGLQSIVDQAITGLPPAMLDLNITAGLGAAPSPFGDGVTLVSGLATTGLATPEPAPRLALRGPAPNPLSTATTFEFTLPAAADVEISIHDVSGRMITTLTREHAPPGPGAIDWDGYDARGARVPAGLYVARLRAGAASASAKLVVIR